VIVAVIAVRMMQPAIHDIIHVIAVRDCFVPAIRPVLVRALGFRCATLRILGTDRDGMFVDMVLMHVVKMTVVNIVHMAVVPDRCVAAAGAMLMRMIEVMLLVASHDCLSAAAPVSH
jgi:hypothetical protein